MSDEIQVSLDDVWVLPAPESIRVSRSMASRGTCEMRFRATEATPGIGQRIGVYDRGVRIFGGTVQDIRLTPIVAQVANSEAWWDITATAWEHRLERRSVGAVAFNCVRDGLTAGQVVTKLHNDYAFAEVFLGQIGDGAGPEELGIVIFRNTNVWECINELARRSNYACYVDPDMHLQFVPKRTDFAMTEVRLSNRNYREPEVRMDRSDYFNRISLTISYEAFDPLILNLPGDQTWPGFDVYDPDDPLKIPLPIDLIRTIKLNGIDQDFGIKVTDENGDITDLKTLYYAPGSSWIEWDPAQPTPAPDDIVTVEFYKIGANVVEVNDSAEQDALSAIEQGGSGIYHACQEDMDLKDLVVAVKRCEQFLDLHCPGRAEGGTRGAMPTEHKWVSDSDDFSDDALSDTWVDDLQPGKIITFNPTTPIGTSQEVIITSVEARDLATNPPVFRYTVSATDVTRMADYLSFYRALAELGPSQSGIRDFPNPVLANRTVIFGIDAPAVTTDVGWYVGIELPAGQIWRPTSAWVTAHVAPVGSDALIDCSYSIDGGVTWSNVFESAAGDLTLGAGLLQTETPLGRFAGFPEPLDIPAGALMRCAVIQVGSTTAGTAFLVNLAGEVRKAVVTA